MASAMGSGGIGALIGGGLGLLQGVLAQRASKKQAHRMKRLLGYTQLGAQKDYESAVEQFLAAPEVAAGLQYLQTRFTDPLAGLEGEAQARVRQAQAARGLVYGGAPVQQEAAFVTRLAERTRQQLLPMLGTLRLQGAQLGEAAYNRAWGGVDRLLGLPQPQSSADIVGSLLSGATGGFQAGGSLYQLGQGQDLYMRLLNALTKSTA